MSQDHWPELFTSYAIEKLADHFTQIRRCVGLLNQEQLWFRPNAPSNSVGNLLLHLRGNIGQWIVNGLGGQTFERNRPAEFAERGSLQKDELIGPLRETLDTACSILHKMAERDLARNYTIQEYSTTGVAAIMHAIEHFSFHTGQIITTTKWLLDVDLSMYDERGHRLDHRYRGAP